MAKKSYKISKIPHDIYHKHKEHFEKIEEIVDHLKQAEQLTEEEILNIFRKKHELKAVPISIFTSWLGPLESLVKYMKEHLGLTFAEIARMLQRDQRTIWLTYRNAKRKNLEISVTHEHFVPLDIFGNRQFSVLENLTVYLHETKGHPFREIANLTKKDNRTIWTVYHRAKKKRKGA